MEPGELKAVFAQRVTSLAKRRQLSINRLADFAGISRGFLSDVLRCRKAPTLRTIACVADALEVEPWELLKPEARDRPRS